MFRWLSLAAVNFYPYLGGCQVWLRRDERGVTLHFLDELFLPQILAMATSPGPGITQRGVRRVSGGEEHDTRPSP